MQFDDYISIVSVREYAVNQFNIIFIVKSMQFDETGCCLSSKTE